MKIPAVQPEKLNQYELIPLITDMIVQKIAPQKIILFGSCAQRCITKASDIDLCIVMKGQITALERIEVRRELLQYLLKITDYEVDLFICGEDEWQKNYKNSGVIIGKIFLEGDLLYGG